MGKQHFAKNEYQKALDYFLKAQITREEAGNDRLGGREVQVEYFVGLAYEALKNRAKATASFTKSSQESTRAVNVMSYYQGLSFVKLGKADQAKKIFESLVSEADRQLKITSTEEWGVYFGAREDVNDRMSRLHTMRGLGYKGLGELQKAKADLDKAVELSRSNIWAREEKVN